jgi:hypothetical protein
VVQPGWIERDPARGVVRALAYMLRGGERYVDPADPTKAATYVIESRSEGPPLPFPEW